MCTEGVLASTQVAEELRVASREGVLRLDALLWHAWISLRVTATALEDAAAALMEIEVEPPSTRRERNAKIRSSVTLIEHNKIVPGGAS